MIANELAVLLPVPRVKGPVATISDWSRLEGELGTRLPSDFKEFHETYGAGSLSEYVIAPLIPLSSWAWNFSESFVETADLVRLYVSQALLPDNTRVFPERGGLLQWAGSGNGHRWFWDTERDDPDAWDVVAMPGDLSSPLVRHTGPVTSYLTELLAGRLQDEFSIELYETLWDPPLSEFVPAGH